MTKGQRSLPHGWNPSYPFMVGRMNDFEALLFLFQGIGELCWMLVDGYDVKGIVQVAPSFPRQRSLPSGSSVVIWIADTMDFLDDSHVFC